MEKFDLLICFRVHKYFEFILDSVDSVEWSINSANTKVVFAVDGFPKLAGQLSAAYSPDRVYLSEKNWGWGIGLFTLLMDSIAHFEKLFSFSHFLSLDYDTIAINKGADQALLNLITNDCVGLLGTHNLTSDSWRYRFNMEKDKIESALGRVPSSYHPGEGVSGSCMLLTEALIEELRAKSVLKGRLSRPQFFTTMSDDSLLPLFVRWLNLDIVDCRSVARCHWKAYKDPRTIVDENIKLFHPVKLTPHSSPQKIVQVEAEIRNFFRKSRGRKSMVSTPKVV